ncbi:MAG: hypothetical protein K2G52_09770 [Muribaculaceae bacterium]|nr:hypothetical protein [Muribaculaceae bacterium]
MSISASSAFAAEGLEDGESLDIILFCCNDGLGVDSGDENDDKQRGERMPQQPIVCSISKDSGITIKNNFDISEISSFEIWNQNTCIASFIDQKDFIDMIFSLKGEYQLIFRFKNYLLSGYISF